MSNALNITAYFDYLCPFAFRGVRLLTEIERNRPEVTVAWRHFSLEQVNALDRGKGEDWNLWEQPLEYRGLWRKQRSRGLAAFLASHAASLQAPEAFARFRLNLYSAYHLDELDLSDPEVLLNAARSAGLDMAEFEAVWQSEDARLRLRDDHLAGLEEAVFGVPTLIINDGEATYLRLSEYPLEEEERSTLFDEITHLLTARPYLQELKRASAG